MNKDYEALRYAAINLYLAGRWDCAEVPPDRAAQLWAELRDACDIQPGTATRLHIGDTTKDAYTDKYGGPQESHEE